MKRIRERTEEGDDTLGSPTSEIEWEGYFGPYENTKLSVHLHMDQHMYIMAYFSFHKNYNGTSIVFNNNSVLQKW
jgi:hypothetical protein